MKTPKKSASFPTPEEILGFIENTSGKVGKREIARAFSLSKEQKKDLKKVLKELKDKGQLGPHFKQINSEKVKLPAVAVVTILGADENGNICAKPSTWAGKSKPPNINIIPGRQGTSSLAAGDKILARLSCMEKKLYQGEIIRKIGSTSHKILGIFTEIDGQGYLKSTDRRIKSEYFVAKEDRLNAKSGDLVHLQVLGKRKMGNQYAKVLEVLSTVGDNASFSQIAIVDQDIPTKFSSEAIILADAAKAAPLGNRDDLRDLPLVTVDGADAKDFDDAIFAEIDINDNNPGGWHLIVCIADVAYYVRPGDALDQDAKYRGNSVYFPDQVVPMLPEALSNGWCSLKPNEERPCLAAHLWINAQGILIRHQFQRSLMKSHARLTYEQLQAARDGKMDKNNMLLRKIVPPLYGAYEALTKARSARGVLELDLPERRIILDKSGRVERVEKQLRYDSHKLIEEFMITANVAAAETLEKNQLPCMYRIHDEPSKDKIDGLRQFLDSLDIPFAKGQKIRAETLNNILKKVRNTPHERLVNDVILRSQSQAEYAPENIGHFGLALRRYCHFTSPIRRYADLLVHRALINSLGLSEDSLLRSDTDLRHLGKTLSNNERRASAAERDAVDRFCASYLSEKIGTTFNGRISGVARFGLFVTLDDTGADGLIPIRSLNSDYFTHDDARHLIRGRRTKQTYRLGDKISVIIVEADPISGSLLLNLVYESKTKITLKAALGSKPKKKNQSKKHKSRSKAGRRKALKKISN